MQWCCACTHQRPQKRARKTLRLVEACKPRRAKMISIVLDATLAACLTMCASSTTFDNTSLLVFVAVAFVAMTPHRHRATLKLSVQASPIGARVSRSTACSITDAPSATMPVTLAATTSVASAYSATSSRRRAASTGCTV